MNNLQKIYLGIVDSPFSSDADFDYHPCKTKEGAVKKLVEIIQSGIEEDEIYIDEDKCDSEEEFLAECTKLLTEEDYVCANGIYYRIKELEVTE